ncbi:MAG: DUF2088 domain-containing protein, partial [Candidatus Latescibacterota bacterium]
MSSATTHSPVIGTSPFLWPVFALSCGLLGFEITVMRVLLYASWHHFAFLVISVVLLGFGASGTALSFLRRWILPRYDNAMIVLVLTASVSMLVSVQLLKHIPVEARFVPTLMTKQVLMWGLYWAVLFAPFLLAASGIGLALMAARSRLPTVYAANLAGSALGALLAPLGMHFFPPALLASLMGIVALLGLIPLSGGRAGPRLGVLTATVLLILVWFWIDPPEIRVDPFKYQHYVDRLTEDERASRLAVAYGPRAVVGVYEGDVFHELAFLSVGETPPPMLAVIMDGHWAGSILRVQDLEGARVVENTLMSVPYSFIEPRPRVLLLGEIGGANIWLAARHRSRSIHVVQPNKELVMLMSGPLHARGGLVIDLPAVKTVLEELDRLGVDLHNVRLVCAVGLHRKWTNRELATILGEDLAYRFGPSKLFNH